MPRQPQPQGLSNEERIAALGVAVTVVGLVGATLWNVRQIGQENRERLGRMEERVKALEKHQGSASRDIDAATAERREMRREMRKVTSQLQQTLQRLDAEYRRIVAQGDRWMGALTTWLASGGKGPPPEAPDRMARPPP